jgi:O-antigen ligase
MISLLRIQELLFYLLLFSLNFERMHPFNTSIDFLVTKITVLLFLFSSLFNVKAYYNLKNIKSFIFPLVAFFVLLSIMNYFNTSQGYDQLFHMALFLNILVLLVTANLGKLNSNVIIKGFFAFSLGSIVVTFMYFIGFETTVASDSRVTLFNSNANDLGLMISISILVIVSLVYENQLNFGRWRYISLLALPFMVLLIIKTGSRIAFVSFLLGVVTFFLLYKQNISIKKISIGIILILFTILIWELFFQYTYLAQRLLDSINMGDISYRDVIWVAAFELINDNIIFGHGHNGWAPFITSSLGVYNSPHNVFIEVLAYTGIIGLIFFITLLIRLIKGVLYTYFNHGLVLPIILFIPVWGQLLSGQIFDSKLLWLIISLIIATYVSKSKYNLNL